MARRSLRWPETTQRRPGAGCQAHHAYSLSQFAPVVNVHFAAPSASASRAHAFRAHVVPMSPRDSSDIHFVGRILWGIVVAIGTVAGAFGTPDAERIVDEDLSIARTRQDALASALP
jgi:hypothetical protein